MNDSRDALSDLVSGAGKEIERLARVESVDLRDELRFRVWPFLVELGETLHATLDEEVDEASAPVDVIARAVGVMLTLINRLGEHLAPAYMEDIARRAAAVMEELRPRARRLPRRRRLRPARLPGGELGNGELG